MDKEFKTFAKNSITFTGYGIATGIFLGLAFNRKISTFVALSMGFGLGYSYQRSSMRFQMIGRLTHAERALSTDIK